MTKQYSIIHLNGFMYIVDKRIPKDEEWYIRDGALCSPEPGHGICDCKPVIGSSDPSLNLPLLPNIEEKDKWWGLAKEEWKKTKEVMEKMQQPTTQEQQAFFYSGFSFGYKAASAKKYTEEDMRNAYHLGMKTMMESHMAEDNEPSMDEFIQSLNPLPIAVEVELELVDNNDFSEHEEGGTYPGIVNSEYQLKVVNNILQVKRWIYE